MTLADTNFWLALTLSRHVFHLAVRDWFDAQPADGPVLFCRATQQSFLRLLSTDAVMRPYGIAAMTNREAWSVYDGLISNRGIKWVVEPEGRKLEARWKQLSNRGSASPKLWMDAYLAAFALTGGLNLVTTDVAFKQFADLDPIVLAGA